MNGIKMSNCKFYVNEAERTIICVIPNAELMITEFIYEHFVWKDIDFWRGMDAVLHKQLIMPRCFVGKAVCAPEDEWNEELGRLLAFSRAKNKCYQSFFKRANLLVQTVDKRLNDMIIAFNDLGAKIDGKQLELQKKIDEAMGFNIEE